MFLLQSYLSPHFTAKETEGGKKGSCQTWGMKPEALSSDLSRDQSLSPPWDGLHPVLSSGAAITCSAVLPALHSGHCMPASSPLLLPVGLWSASSWRQPSHESWSSLVVVVFSVTHHKTCGELLRINYFSKDLQSLNAPGGIFFFFLTILGKFSVYFQHKDATASVIRTEKMKLFSIGYRLRVSIRNSYACKFSFVMHLLTFLLCCQC